MAEGPIRPAGAARIWAGAVSTTSMLALITLMVPARDAPGRARIDPAVWWYVARASGLTAWALLAVSVVAGLLLTTRFTPGNTRSWTQALHGFLGPLAVVFTVVHLVSVLGTDRLGIGPRELLVVSGPRNQFPLVASSAYLFIAGGIGITAMLAMATRVAAAGGEWKLVYYGRSRGRMAFFGEVRALDPDRVEVVPRDERGSPDLDQVIGAASPGTAVYCCGPDRMLSAVQLRVADRPDLSMHSERFAGAAAGGHAFHVELRRTGRIVEVPADRTVLQAVRDVLPTVRAGCEQGVCGSCRITVLAGEPDHRDQLLSEAERAAGAMLICVSRARREPAHP